MGSLQARVPAWARDHLLGAVHQNEVPWAIWFMMLIACCCNSLASEEPQLPHAASLHARLPA